MGRSVYRAPWYLLLAVTLAACAATATASREMVLEPVARPGLRIDRSGKYFLAGQASRNFRVSAYLLMSQGENTDARIISARLMVANDSGHIIHFGPSGIFLVDSSKTLLFRLSETWLNRYYEARKANVPMSQYVPAYVPPQSYVYSSTSTRIGNYNYTTGVLRADPYAQLGAGLGNLLGAALLAAERAHAMREVERLEEERQQISAFLLRESEIPSGTVQSGHVYFYNPPHRKLTFPLVLLIKIEKDMFPVEYGEPKDIKP